jgi:PAS domain S-box-containing protein
MKNDDQFVGNDLLLRKMFESAAESILIVNKKGHILSVNQSCTELFGYSEKEMIGMNVDDLLPSSLKNQHKTYRKAYYKDPGHRKMGQGRDLFGLKKDKTRIPLEISLNHVQLKDEQYVIAFIVDISARKQAESVIKREKELSETYFNQALSIFVVLDIKMEVLKINRKGAETLGWRPEKLAGMNWIKTIIPEENQKDIAAVLNKLANSTLPSLEFFVHDVLTRSGKKRTVEWYTTLIQVDNTPHSILLSGVDITYRKEIESNKTRAMMLGQEAERKRVAKELHDGLGQSLSAMNMHLGVLEKEKRKLNSKSINSLETLKNLLENTIVEVKSISYDLMPKILESYGLTKALNYLCDIINEGGKLSIQLQSFGLKERLDSEIEVGLYRIAQELINNVIKHAAAKNINMQLIRHEKSLVFMIEDDGIGFETMRSKSDVKGLGLKNISTRVNSFNGSFYIDSLPGKGTTITIELPI